MTDITNADRSAWAATAIDAFTLVCRMDGEDDQTRAKDLATNLVHYLRIECGMSFDEASVLMQNAVNMAHEEAEEDDDGDDQPIEREYGVRLWATFRASAQTTVTATSLAEAIEKAKLEKDGFQKWEIESCDGDESVHVFGPEDENGEDFAWAGDGIEIDMRKDGEPFSWDACQLVKDLAKLNPIAELLRGDDMKASVSVDQLGVIANLIIRAREMCTVEKDDDANIPAT